MATESVLVNFVYAHNVGHAIEALHYAHGYHLADPDRRIALVLNKKTPVELASFCDCVDEVFEVEVDLFDGDFDAAPALAGIPRDWDWVVGDLRGTQDVQRELFPGLARYYDTAATHFRAAKGTGSAGLVKIGPSYRPHQELRLNLPRAELDRGAALLGDAPVKIAVLPGGSAPREYYPSTASWELILGGLAEKFPGARFCFLGKLDTGDGRTGTSFGAGELDRLRTAFPSVAAVDVPLVDQLGALAACDLLISPHSGFSFTASALGVPWLALSGNRWPEYYFNGVPFYSVLPDRERFPCYSMFAADPDPVDEPGGPHAPSMSQARFAADLPEIVAGAQLLLGDWSYPDALSDHFQRLNRRFPDWSTWFFAIDGVHLPFIS
ncbi:glycosyltransferase family 9 protein [Crossiella cryophila]|uniref:ADP-heptose:LPS heptosyltransferase n=1 Tax=Crossiella cryophila TaxID=43355 RepID=A0A7W7CFZ4_9PSEU|nr:hypothetical protein [Crossiella cryophila]MBB4679126.1 hypothetical protein [Crossiella cryophila]